MTGPLGTVPLIDTPGIDNFGPSATEVLDMIIKFTRRSSLPSVTLDGIIFVLPVDVVRIRSCSMNILSAFTEGLAPSFYNRVVLATTMWEKDQQYIFESGNLSYGSLLTFGVT